MARILLVGGGRQLHDLIRERTPGLRTVVLARSSALALVSTPEANDFVGLLAEDAPIEDWTAAARLIRSIWPFERVTALAEIDQDRAAAIAENLGLAYHSPALVDLVNDKYRMRAVLGSAGLTAVQAAQPPDEDAAAGAADRLGYPVIVKPNGGRGSAGVRVAHDGTEVVEAFREARRIGADAGAERACLVPSAPMIEQLIKGRELSVEAFTHDGRHYIAAITEKFVDAETKVEIGHVVPARITSKEHMRVAAYVDDVLTALGVSAGVTHTEVMLLDHGVEIIETHLRKAGDEILELVRDATGWVLDDAAVDQAATGAFVPPSWSEKTARAGGHYSGAAAIWFALADRLGRVSRIDGVEKVREKPHVRDAKALVDVGAEVKPTRSSLERVARVRVVAPDANTAIAQATLLLNAIDVVTEPIA